MKKAGAWIAVMVGITTLMGAVWRLDSRYVKQIEIDSVKTSVEQVSARLDNKIATDRMNAIQERLWYLEDKFGMEIKEMPEAIRTHYRKLKQELEEINKKLRTDP